MADRAVVVGAGSFGTAVAVLLARAGARTTLLARTATQAEVLRADRENKAYLAGVGLPPDLRIASLAGQPLARAHYVFLPVPSPARERRLPGQGPRAARRHGPDRTADRPDRRRARRLHRWPRPRAGDGDGG